MLSRKKAKRSFINLPRAAALPFSDAVLVGDTLYLSGRIGIDPVTGMAPESIDDEMKLLFDGFEAVLAKARMSMNDLVWVQIFCPDVSLWERFNATYRDGSPGICRRGLSSGLVRC